MSASSITQPTMQYAAAAFLRLPCLIYMSKSLMVLHIYCERNGIDVFLYCLSLYSLL